MRKVDTRKFAKLFKRGVIICLRRSLAIGEISNMFAAYSRNPFSLLTIPANTLKSRRSIASRFRILMILGFGTLSKVVATIIKCVPIAMIPDFPAFKVEDDSVHRNFSVGLSSSTIVGASIAMSIFGVRGKPRPFHQPFVVGGVNYGDLAL